MGNSLYLAKYLIRARMALGVCFNLIGSVSLFIGFYSTFFFFACLGSLCIGLGSATIFVSLIALMKYFPTRYFMMFFIGNRFGGFLLTVTYLLSQFYGIKVYKVPRPPP